MFELSISKVWSEMQEDTWDFLRDTLCYSCLSWWYWFLDGSVEYGTDASNHTMISFTQFAKSREGQSLLWRGYNHWLGLIIFLHFCGVLKNKNKLLSDIQVLYFIVRLLNSALTLQYIVDHWLNDNGYRFRCKEIFQSLNIYWDYFSKQKYKIYILKWCFDTAN